MSTRIRPSDGYIMRVSPEFGREATAGPIQSVLEPISELMAPHRELARRVEN
jgi:hypothetical protein